MLVISQNLTNYNIPIPNDAILRINLAWIDNLKELSIILKKHKKNLILLDLPVRRIKPPHNQYSIEDLIPVIESNEHIRYVAISNVESLSDYTKYYELLPMNITIIPKIESVKAISNITEITNSLKGRERILMLDHDDLFSSVIRMDEPLSHFKSYVDKLINFCEQNKITLLRARGIIFSDYYNDNYKSE